ALLFIPAALDFSEARLEVAEDFLAGSAHQRFKALLGKFMQLLKIVFTDALDTRQGLVDGFIEVSGQRVLDDLFGGGLQFALHGGDQLVDGDGDAFRLCGGEFFRRLRAGCGGRRGGERGYLAGPRFVGAWRGSRGKGVNGGWRRSRLQSGSDSRGQTRGVSIPTEQAIPIRRRRRNIPDIRGGFELDANLEKFAGAGGRMDGFHEGPNDRRNGFAVGVEHAKADGRADGIFMARRIAAAMKIKADGGRFFLEREAGFSLPEHDERNIAFNARAAAAFQAGKRMKMIWGSG